MARKEALHLVELSREIRGVLTKCQLVFVQALAIVRRYRRCVSGYAIFFISTHLVLDRSS